MKLTPKILLILLSTVIPFMCSFAGVGIYFFSQTLKQDAVKTHKLVYSLFLPVVSSYLWEYDTDGIEKTLLNIMKNNYASEIGVFDIEGNFIFGFAKGKKENPVRLSKIEEFSASKLSMEKIKKLTSKSDESNLYPLFEINQHTHSSQMVGLLFHKKTGKKDADPIGFIHFTYSNMYIVNIIQRSIMFTIIFTILVAILLVITISFILNNTLINIIIQLNKASLTIAMGKKRKITEKKGNDEIAELIRNFNIMADQIDLNLENLKLVAEEGIKISSCVSIEAMAQQIRESVNKITNNGVKFDFYISSHFLDKVKEPGFIKINEEFSGISHSNQIDIIPFGEEYKAPQGVRRTFIKDNIYGEVSAILEILNFAEGGGYFNQEERIYSSVHALQVSTASALSTMSFIRKQQEQLRLVAEQETARLVQNNLLPKQELRKILNYEIISHFESASECAGDWWSAYTLPNNKLLLLLGDVTGHGTASALLTAVVKGYCDSLCQQQNISTTEVLSQLDKLVSESSSGERVMTMFAAILDPKKNTVEFANAAHNFPYVIRNRAGNISIKKLIACGRPLGFNSKIQDQGKACFASQEEEFQTNDIILIFSDGLVEATNRNKEEFTERKLKKILESVKDKNISEIKEEILKNFRYFTDHQNLEDDMTFLICKFLS